MSVYATKWCPISAEEYRKIYDGALHVYASYTNPDGDDGLTYEPQILTTWGDDEKELIKSVARRPTKHDEWSYEHWKAVEWEDE